MAKQKKQIFLRTIKFDKLPVCKVGEEVTSEYKAAIEKLSEADKKKYIGEG